MPLIGAVNAGSSSLKLALFSGEGCLARETLALPATMQDGAGVIKWFEACLDGAQLTALGHRVVHGGEQFSGPAHLDPSVIAALEALTPLAPLHQPLSLGLVRSVAQIRPNLPQVACFDTAFHRTNSALERVFALPKALSDEGIRRYGFHGLSYEYVASALREIAPDVANGRVVVAHLGSGASLCALENGVSRATTMGMSVLDGLPMGTRPGDLDPGVLLYLLRERGYTPEQLEDLLYHRCGLLGLSGISADVRELEASADPAAAFALELFSYRVAAGIAGMASALGGIDGLVFTAGIGEHSVAQREAIAARCAWLGVELDRAQNALHAGWISAHTSRVAVLVVSTDEERTIARQTAALL